MSGLKKQTAGQRFNLVLSPGRPLRAELARQLALHRSGGNRVHGAEDRAQAHGVQSEPLAVTEGLGDPGDLVVDVVAGGRRPGWCPAARR
jgi:hypothetical protein